MTLKRLLSLSNRPLNKASIKEQMRSMEKKKKSTTKNLTTKLAADKEKAAKLKEVNRLHQMVLAKALPDVFPDRNRFV